MFFKSNSYHLEIGDLFEILLIAGNKRRSGVKRGCGDGGIGKFYFRFPADVGSDSRDLAIEGDECEVFLQKDFGFCDFDRAKLRKRQHFRFGYGW